jgi:hypothetical protein
MSTFMKPEYTTQDFFEVEFRNGETEYIHMDAFGTKGDVSGLIKKHYDSLGTPVELVSIVQDKWWCRLSAPGYLDATDWLGPFDTKKEAMDELSDVYDVDPETGEGLGLE